MTMDEPEKLDLRSHDIVGDKMRELLRLFPEIRTETGKFDFERLRLALGETVDIGKERYGMNWPGKADCFKAIQAPSLGTLRPCPEESVAWDTTENLIIEGDNLEVLKLLQKSYLGKIKMIYIDPPYNTGNDFIYPDNYTESLQTYLEYTGQVDAEGKKFGTNTDTDGRFHSKWLNMMYPRLYLARDLLTEDGFLVCGIDDSEISNLRRVLDEVFGEENHIATLVYDRNRKNDAKLFSVGHEYAVVYAKNKLWLSENEVVLRVAKEGVDEVRQAFEDLRRQFHDDWKKVRKGLLDLYGTWPDDDARKPLSRFTKVDERGPYRDDHDISWPGGGGPRYDVLHPVTGKPCKVPSRGWVYPKKKTMDAKIAQGLVAFGPDETTVPSIRTNLFEKTSQVLRSVHFSYAQSSTQELLRLFDGSKVFDNPKNAADIKQLIEYLTPEESMILDFFAGSGTTAQAVIELNRQDGGNRKFILVQLPESTGRQDYPTIADICKERVRRVIRKLHEADGGQLPLWPDRKLNRGFRVFKLAESNFKPWNGDVATGDVAGLARQLEMFVEHIRKDRTAEDILHELLLKSGFPLTTPVEKLTLAGKSVHSAAGGTLLICLERRLTLELIRAMAELKPERVVCLDRGFAGNDQLKANAVQIFRTKGVTSFRTV
jgi:adenine-specific DNA-methyltransferase